jgi:pimeloyl-ACP methyl ester carboxylesterase
MGPLMGRASLAFVREAMRLSGRATFLFGDLTREQAEILRAMIRDTPLEFLRWGGRALSRWTGPRDLPMPVYHIHGERDRIIPHRLVRPDVTVMGGGHLINVTHADEVNRYLKERMDAHLRGTP